MTRRPFTAEDVFNLKCSGDAGSPVPFTVKDSVNLTAHLDRQAGGMAGAEPRYGGSGPSLNWDGDTDARSRAMM